MQTPPDSNKSGEEARCRVRAEELSKMFPTPPSMEAHAQPSPGFTLPDERLLLAPPAPPAHAPRDAGSPAPDQPIEVRILYHLKFRRLKRDHTFRKEAVQWIDTVVRFYPTGCANIRPKVH